MIRRQPPVYSPLTAGALAGALKEAWAPVGDDPRDALSTFLTGRYGADRVVLLGSGTQALTLAIRLARNEDDGPVALPAFTCFDVATAAIGAGAPVILYDLDPETLGPDWASLETALEAGARVVVVAYLYGLPVDWDRVQGLARRYDATVVEDAAQGVGASWRGRPLGSLGELSVLSFGRGKGWTGGRGGALLVRDKAPEAGPLPSSGAPHDASTALQLLAQWALGRPSLYGLPYRIPWLHLGETRYREPEAPGGIPRLSAAAVLATAELAEEEAGRRRHTAALLRRASEQSVEVSVPDELEQGVPGYLRLPCRVRDSGERDRLLSSLGNSGVGRSYPTGLAGLPEIQGRVVAPTPTPGAEALAAELIALPTHSLLRPRDLDRLTTGISGRR